MPSTLLAHLTVTASTEAPAGPTARPDGLTKAEHWSSSSLPSRLNREWALLCDSAVGRRSARHWAAPSRSRAALSELVGVDGLHATVQLLQSTEVTARDRHGILVGLLERAQDGDGLAGRVVLQTMLPAAVRVAQAITSRPDVLGDQDEAFALVLAALWQVVATYPVASRRTKVPEVRQRGDFLEDKSDAAREVAASIAGVTVARPLAFRTWGCWLGASGLMTGSLAAGHGLTARCRPTPIWD